MFNLLGLYGGWIPIWYYDTLQTPVGTIDIGLIRDEANAATPRRGSKIEVPPMSENLVEMVELAQGADPPTSDLADTTPSYSTHVANRNPSSS